MPIVKRDDKENIYKIALDRAQKDAMNRTVTPNVLIDGTTISDMLKRPLITMSENEGKIEIISSKLPKHYIINQGATILFWEDGTKTIVKRCADDTYDKRLGFLTAYFQKNCGLSKDKANKFLANLEEEKVKE